MKKIIATIYLFGLFLLFLSCQGFLNVTPEDAILEEDSYESLSDFKRHWRGVYATLKNAGGFTEAVRIYGDIQCDLAYAVQGNSNVLRELCEWKFSSSTSEVTSLYYAMWSTIGQINEKFDNLDQLRIKLTQEENETVDLMLGDFYMIRALCYSKLVEYYCEGYDPDSAHEQLGMPLCESTRNQKLSRSSLKDTYTFMYRDLRRADSLLSSITYQDVMRRRNFLFTRQCATALWARLALNQKDYKLAASKAQETLDYCLGIGMRLDVDTTYYGNLFCGSDYGEELLFFIGMYPEDVSGSVGRYFMNAPYQVYLPEFVPSRFLLSLYDENDYRKYVFFDSEQQTGYSHGLIWDIIVKDGHNSELDISKVNYTYQSMPKLFRLSELYLILAEAHLLMEGGDLKVANSMLSDLRKARILNYQDDFYTSKDLFREIKIERVRELCFEGFRLPDLKRWGDGFRRYPQSFTKSPENQLMIEGNNVRFTWPIPKSELEINKMMQPNKSN